MVEVVAVATAKQPEQKHIILSESRRMIFFKELVLYKQCEFRERPELGICFKFI